MNIFSKISNLKKKPYITIFLMLLIIGLVLSFAGSGVEAAKVSVNKSNKHEFNIEVGSSISANGEYYTVSIDIENPGKDFSGFIRMGTDMSDYSMGYDVDISIPSGSTKTYTINVPSTVSNSQNVVQIQVYDSKDHLVYAERFRSVFSSQKYVLNTGILSDDADALSFMDNGGSKIDFNGEKYSVKLSTLDAKNISTELDSLRVLIINDYDTSTLSKEVIEKIRSWTTNGGVLVLGTGENAEKVFSGFDSTDSDYIDLDYQTTSEYEDGIGNNTTKYVIAIFDDNFDYIYLTEYSSIKSTGNGGIIVFNIDLKDFSKDETIKEQEVYSLYNNVLTYTGSGNNAYSYKNPTTYDVENAQGYMEKPAKTGSGILAFLIIIYVALVGPVIYLILKALNKREIIWIAIPALSAVFVLLIFLISLGVRIRGVSLDSVTAINVDAPTKKSYIFGYAPEPDKWSIETKEPFTCGELCSLYTYHDESKVDATMKQKTDSTVLTFFPSKAFDTNCFVLYSDSNISGGFDFEVDLTDYSTYSGVTGVSEGTFTNNSGIDFDYMLFLSPNGSQFEESVENGDVVSVDVTNNNSSYYSSNSILNDFASKPYDNKEYDKSAAIAAMALTVSEIDVNNQELVVVGVRKSKSLTQENENSWECYYKIY